MTSQNISMRKHPKRCETCINDSPVDDLNALMKEWERIKSEISDTECGGETFEFLSEWWSPETGTAQHALWRGCENIVKLCLKINSRLNMSYAHPIDYASHSSTQAAPAEQPGALYGITELLNEIEMLLPNGSNVGTPLSSDVDDIQISIGNNKLARCRQIINEIRARGSIQQQPEPCEIEGDPCLCMDSPCSRMKEHDAAIRAAAKGETLEKVVKIIAAHVIHSDDFSKDGIKSGWILVGGWEPLIEEIESLKVHG